MRCTCLYLGMCWLHTHHARVTEHAFDGGGTPCFAVCMQCLQSPLPGSLRQAVPWES